MKVTYKFQHQRTNSKISSTRSLLLACIASLHERTPTLQRHIRIRTSIERSIIIITVAWTWGGDRQMMFQQSSGGKVARRELGRPTEHGRVTGVESKHDSSDNGDGSAAGFMPGG